MSSPDRLRFQRLRLVLCIAAIVISVVMGCDGTPAPTVSPVTPTATVASPISPVKTPTVTP